MAALDYLLEQLRTAVDKEIGDAAAPDDRTLPYGIVYPAGEAARGGPVSRPNDDRDVTVQVTAVGAGRQDTTQLLDECAEAILALRSLGPDTDVLQISVLLRRSLGRDDKVHPPVFTQVEQYRILTTPNNTPAAPTVLYPSAGQFPSPTLYPIGA